VKRHRAIIGAQLVLDALMAMLAAYVAYQLRFHVVGRRIPIPGGEPPDPLHYVAAAPVAALVVVVVFLLLGVYRQRRGVLFIDELFAVVWGMAAAALVGLALTGLYHEFTYSRVTYLFWAILATLLIALARYALRRYQTIQRARGNGADRAVVVGCGYGADMLVQRIRMFPDYGYRLLGVLADCEPADGEMNGVDLIGGVDDLEQVVQAREVDVVFIALSDIDSDQTLQLIERCRRVGVDFRIMPGILQLMATQVTADQIDGIPLIQYRHGLDIQGPKTLAKRIFDVVVAGLALILISPLLAVIALLVRLSSPGPILIHQERVGMRGTRFLTHKFRSMRVDAEAQSGPVWATAEDPRRTPIGKWLRRFSLDELPQLWNIVRGEMSLVGPRPERPSFVSEFSQRLPRYGDRHLVRPGLTGWAQANDLRAQTPVQERLTYDLYYIENWSLAFDLKIILITAARVWTHKNAY
jgi:exopolysaccharide biosynthesis polyprenyl glycosylphosphotransferase